MLVEKKAAAVFYYLKDTGSVTITANTFGIYQCTLTQIVKEVCSAVVTYMVPKLVFAAVNDSSVDNFSAVIDYTLNFACAPAKQAQKYNSYFGFQRKLY